MPDQNLNEGTTVNLKVQTWWQLMLILGTICACSMVLYGRFNEAAEKSDRAYVQSQRNSEQIMQMQSDIRDINTNVGWFRQQYERDNGRNSWNVLPKR